MDLTIDELLSATNGGYQEIKFDIMKDENNKWETLIRKHLADYETASPEEKELIQRKIIDCAMIADQFIKYLNPNK